MPTPAPVTRATRLFMASALDMGHLDPLQVHIPDDDLAFLAPGGGAHTVGGEADGDDGADLPVQCLARRPGSSIVQADVVVVVRRGEPLAVGREGNLVEVAAVGLIAERDAVADE